MNAARNLGLLRGLQALREHRTKSDHASAVRAKREAAEKTKQAAANLSAHTNALENDASRGELRIDRFQILAELITQSEARFRACEEAEAKAREDEARAARLRVQAEKQSEHLAVRHSEARLKERRKSEEREARGFLSSRAVAPGEKR